MSRTRRILIQIASAFERVRYASRRRPLLAVLAGTGDENFGDEWMAAALRLHLPSWQIIELLHPVVERRFARVGLSGDALFDGLLISGGTLFNEYFFERARPMLRFGLPAWSVGTGAGSAGFGVSDDDARPEVWVESLRRFDTVTVRGPISASRLTNAGVAGVEAIGDLAMLHADDAPAVRYRDRCDRVLVNVSGIGNAAQMSPREHAVLEATARGIEALRKHRWRPVPFSVHRDDLERLEALGSLIGGWTEEPIHATAATWSAARLSDVRAIVATRLHAAAVGWIYGRDVVALGYRSKVTDLALQVGAEADVIDLATDDPAWITATIADLVNRDPARADLIHARVVTCRDRQRELLAEIDRMADR